MRRGNRGRAYIIPVRRAGALCRIRRQRVGAGVHPEERWAAWLARLLLLTMLVASLVLVLALLNPFLHAIILAVLVASLLYPVHRWLLLRTGGRRNLSALLSVSLVFVILLVPTALFMSALVRQAVETVQVANGWIVEGRLREVVGRVDIPELLQHPVMAPLRGPVQKWLDVEDLREVDLSNSRLAEAIGRIGQMVLNWLGSLIRPLLAGGGRVVVGFGIMLFVMYFAFRDGPAALAYVRRLSPLTATQENALLQRIRDVTRAVLFGTVVTALAQGFAAMIGFRMVGIPALFWGTLVACCSLIPAVGTALVWVPCVVYLFAVGRPGPGILLAAWCVLVVGTIDNFLRPILMGGRVGMSAVVVFLSIVGGIQFFGAVGIIYGPMIFGLCAVCLYIYELENAEFLTRQEQL
ncbi:MAG: AI-2E family transporter [Lentisphaeria bacterium]|nr:AI-2E family transporter [Lentisphaeria bacterium]